MQAGSKTALLVIDMLNDFILEGAPTWVPDGAKIVPAVARRIRQARAAKDTLIYVCDAHDPDDEEFKLWPPHAVNGTPGAAVIDALAPEQRDLVIRKKRFSGFYQSELDGALIGLGVSHLQVTGTVTNICVLYTVADARARGYEVTVFQDSVAGLDPEGHHFALRQMETVLGAIVR
jgi:nicotinamidase-related amidase